MNDVNSGCNIMIPTYNRPDYLQRILDYYDNFREEFRIIIADSSRDEIKEINEKTVHSVSNLNIKYLNHYPTEKNHWLKYADMLNYATEKYGLICADDDFITPTGINQAVEFLEKNADFTVAHGRSLRFWPRSVRGNRQQFFCKLPDRFLSITFAEPDKRLSHHLSHYAPTFYGVHRKDFLKLIFKEGANFFYDCCFSELLLSVLTLIYGKTKCLEVFYAAREASPDSLGVNRKKLKDLSKDDLYKSKWDQVIHCLSVHLAGNSKLTLDEAKEVVDDAMSLYLLEVTRIKKPIKDKLARRTKNSLENSKLPRWIYKGVRSIYRRLFLSKQKWMGDSKSFANTPFSKYYNDINDIHNHLLAYSNPEKW